MNRTILVLDMYNLNFLSRHSLSRPFLSHEMDSNFDSSLIMVRQGTTPPPIDPNLFSSNFDTSLPIQQNPSPSFNAEINQVAFDPSIVSGDSSDDQQDETSSDEEIPSLMPQIQLTPQNNTQLFSNLMNLSKPSNVTVGIHTAAYKGDLNSLKCILQKFPDRLNLQDKYGFTPLIHACIKSRKEIVDYLLSINADVSIKSKFNRTPLMYACSQGNLQIATALVDKGADVNVRDRRKETPLMWACEQGNLDLVKYLISKGANQNLQNKHRKKATDFAQAKNHQSIVSYLSTL